MASSSKNQTPFYSSSTTSLPTRWDVFLSFRGEDTRYKFTGFVYQALQRLGVQTFMDDPELRSGDIISDSLKQAIQGSRTYVVVFSKNYAFSRWCLDELVLIMSMGRLVVPVFYNIDPSVVHRQTGRFSEAFDKHATRSVQKDTLDKWRVTLTSVAKISGYHVCKNTSQAGIINQVVDRILLEIIPTALGLPKYPVGLDSRVKDLTTMLSSDTEGVIRIGIHGMGGIGKTTLAQAVYTQNNQYFQGSCFLANVRENSVTERGLVRLQQQLIDDVLKCRNIKIHNIDHGIGLIRERVCSKKVLIVLDDLDNTKALEFLEGPFALGSVIIVTTRNEDLLDSIDVKARYKVKGLRGAESRKLFTKHAFRDNKISDSFTVLIEMILKRAGGVPLALKVFGSNLFNHSEERWRWFIEKLKLISIGEVEKILVVSFDALKLVDPNLQDMFLDIACFFVGKKKEKVVKILETTYTFVNLKIDILRKRCLVTINERDRFEMHDLLREMGRRIVRNNSPDEPGKHSRLWASEEIFDVLKKHKGTEAVEGIISRRFYFRDSFATETFNRMSKLRFLRLSYVNLTGSFQQIFEDLRFFKWVGCPLKCLPSDFCPPKLVMLELPRSCLRTMRELNVASQVFEKLKTLNMWFSRNLTTTLDFTKLPCLETLDLSGCESLEDVHSSIGSLVSLVSLYLFGCSNLRSLPETICNLRALKVLDIRCCTSLEALPVGLGNIKSLELLYAEELTVSTLPDSIGHLSKLVTLELSYNTTLETLPDAICNLRALEVLKVDHCPSLKALPSELGNIESLIWLRIDGVIVSTLLHSIERLTNLDCLSLSWNEDIELFSHHRNCEETSLETLDISVNTVLDLSPSGPWKMELLRMPRARDACQLRRLPCKEPSQNALSFRWLIFSKSFYVASPSDVSHFSNLQYLTLENCSHLLSIVELPLNLKRMWANGNMSLSRLQNRSKLKKWIHLEIANCRNLRAIQVLKKLTCILYLRLSGCNSSFLSCTFTVRLFEIYSIFGPEIEIYTSEFPDWLRQSTYNPAGSTLFLDLPPDVSRNFSGMILCFKHLGNKKSCGYSVKNSTSGYIRRGRLIYNESLIVIVPRTIFSLKDGDARIEFTSDADLFGIYLLYKTENTAVD